MGRWLVIHPEVFIFISTHNLLFYNAISCEYKTIKLNDGFTKLHKYMQNPANAYVMEIDDEFYNSNYEDLEELKNREFLDIKECALEKRPLSYPPILKLEYGCDLINYEYESNQAGAILSFLKELNIFCSGDINGNQLYKQVLYPLDNSNLRIDNADLLSFIKSLKFSGINAVNFVVNSSEDIHNYSNIIDYLYEQITCCITIHTNYKGYDSIKHYLKDNNYENLNLILVCTPEEFNNIKDSFANIKLLIESKESNIIANNILLTHKADIEIIPIYNNNIDFFKENVYIEHDELFSSTKREILSKSVLNNNYFGRLFVLPNGEVYSNINKASLGNIQSRLYDLIYTEINSERGWLLTRDKILPCKDCIFRYLCPSIGNYEFIIGKFDLCNILSLDR